jgi:ribosomal-protein-alanine N-acetyltransferase
VVKQLLSFSSIIKRNDAHAGNAALDSASIGTCGCQPDAGFIAHWEVVRYLTNLIPWPYPPDGAYKFYRDVTLPAVARGEEWAWTLRFKANPDQLIGAISLFRGEKDNRGFWIGLPWQNQGLMTEASDAVTNYWFDVLKFPLLRAGKAIANTASRRISEKQGMRIITLEDRDYVSGRFPAEVREITAEEWHARRPSDK